MNYLRWNSQWADAAESISCHPVSIQNLYRYDPGVQDHGGRFEQIGQSWLKNISGILQTETCSSCNPQTGNDQRAFLAVNCSDTYNSLTNAEIDHLGPKSDVDPYTGAGIVQTGVQDQPDASSFAKGQLLVNRADLPDPQLPDPDMLYYFEHQSVVADDAAEIDESKTFDNSMYTRVPHSFFEDIPAAGCPPDCPTLGVGPLSQHYQSGPAIYAWQAKDPLNVVVVGVADPNGGRYLIAYKVTELSGQPTVWQYEYAVFNWDSAMGMESFRVPVDDDATISEIEFHDVDYHSGDPIDGTDWAVTYGGPGALFVDWTAVAASPPENTNYLRWGTLYNYRLRSNTPPATAALKFGFTDQTQANVNALVPGPPTL